MGVIQLLASKNYIIVNKELIKVVGLEETILLGELAGEYDYYESQDKLEDGFFFSTVEMVEENTGLTDYQQRKAINSLKEKGLIEAKVKGLPPKRYIKINEEAILKLFKNKNLKNLRINSKKTKELNLKKLKTINNNKLIINKNNNILKENLTKESLETEFEELWKLYPNKKGKKDALRHYIKARKNVPFEKVKKGIESYIAYIESNNIKEQYIKHGSSWFNQECWNDNYDTKKQTTKSLEKFIDVDSYFNEKGDSLW